MKPDLVYTTLMRLPNSEEIEALYLQYRTPPHIQDHMHVVSAIACALGRYHQANLPLLEAAAKLHDLVRLPEQWPYLPTTISTPQPHAEINYRLLRAQWPEVAQAIRPHSLMTIFDPNPFSSLEAKLVYYADKRVNHATIVSLSDRLQLGQVRWHVSKEQDRSSELLVKLLALEAELFKPVSYDPTQLEVHIQTHH